MRAPRLTPHRKVVRFLISCDAGVDRTAEYWNIVHKYYSGKGGFRSVFRHSLAPT